jgi:hypothetical protein
MVLKIKFGETIKSSGNIELMDSYGLRLYGYFPEEMQLLFNIGLLSEPMVEYGSSLTDCQHITFWFQYHNLLPIGQILSVSDKIDTKLGELSYVKVRSSLDNLVDATKPSYKDKPEGQFPAEPSRCGYNAAKGFSVAVEKPGTTAAFSIDDIDSIQQMAIEFGRIVFGRPLEAIY